MCSGTYTDTLALGRSAAAVSATSSADKFKKSDSATAVAADAFDAANTAAVEAASDAADASDDDGNGNSDSNASGKSAREAAVGAGPWQLPPSEVSSDALRRMAIEAVALLQSGLLCVQVLPALDFCNILSTLFDLAAFFTRCAGARPSKRLQQSSAATRS